jgi:putative membrane protein
MGDVLLSSFHFLLIFMLVAVLAAQYVLIRPGMTASSLRLAANLDRMYGLSAVLLLGVGFGRVYWGAKGSSFYLSNPLFWTKIGLFTTVALLSIPPTVQLIQWSNQAHSQPEYLPSEKQVSRLQWWLRAEVFVLLLIPFVAAAMARGMGFS